MKKILLSILILCGLSSVGLASTPPAKHSVQVSNAECAYTVFDVMAGLQKFVPVSFVERSKSPDGNKKMGFVLYHNPASSNEKSIDAMALMIVDRRFPDKQLVLVVIYIGPQKSTVFKREIKNDGKELGACFVKSLEDNP